MIFSGFKQQVLSILKNNSFVSAKSLENKKEEQNGEIQPEDQNVMTTEDASESLLSLENIGKQYEIRIEEEYSHVVLKSIPILSDKRGVSYWQLKTEEQLETDDTCGMFQSQAFREIREFLVFEGLQQFVLSELSDSDESRESVKLSIVQHVDRPDFYIMRVF